MKLIKKVQVKNRMGLHTRPATAIVKILRNVKSSVTFTYKKQTVNAKSILSLLMLAARFNTTITLCIEGEDAQQTMECLVNAFENHFGEQ